jgi:hypothetical protein
LRLDFGAVAQLGERLVRNEEVSGSIPLGSTTYLSPFHRHNLHVALNAPHKFFDDLSASGQIPGCLAH